MRISKYLDFINESSQNLPKQVDRDTFMKKEKEFTREKFNSREIEDLKKIDFEDQYLIPLHKIKEGWISDNISFETKCLLYYIVIIKLEDEWYLIEERARKMSLLTKYFICDGFEQVINYINHINEKFK
jgi:hypothetical protein